MADPYRENEAIENEGNAVSPEILESRPEEAIEILPEAEIQKSAPFDFSREGLVTEQELEILKSIADVAATKGIGAANEAAKEYASANNAPHLIDLWHDYSAKPENQSRLGIEQL
jgi:hypothetical protein